MDNSLLIEPEKLPPGYGIENIPTEGEKKLLISLVYDTDLSEKEQEDAFVAINNVNSYKAYEAIQHRLESRKKPFETKVNPSQKDINNKLKAVQK